MRVVSEIFQQGEMPAYMKKSVTILIPKKDKDRRNVENLRPISLLNVHYKIITKALATKVQKVVSSLINEDQTGFLKGRFIGENVRLILDLIDYCSEKNISALILACDFERAYDSLNWTYLKRVIRAFGFGPNIQKWMDDIMYDDDPAHATEAVIQLNGHLSRPYEIKRGLRQGCPLSCYLFLLALEPLLNQIRNDQKIAGVQIGENSIKVSAYADDTTIILDGSQQSLVKVLNLFETFSLRSGLKLNMTKTKAFWIGRNAHEKPPLPVPFNIQWPTEPVNIFFFIKNKNYVCMDVCMYVCLSVPFGGLLRKSGES